MEKLLIIGAGIGQRSLLEKAKRRNIHVTVATIPGPYPCIDLADDVIVRDIFDMDGIVEEAQKRNITAVISDQNDLMNPTVAYVAEKLKLPGNSFDTVVSYCNKNKFRDNCEKAGVPVPRHREIISLDDNIDDIDFSLPWIVKPADSQSSIGVQIVNNDSELISALQVALDKSPTHSAIVEEYFCGSEIVCEGLIDNGQYFLLSFADRKYFHMPNLFIPCQTLFPSCAEDELLGRIIEYESRLAAHFSPSFAIVHSEYLIDVEKGDIRIVESALRGGGVYISSDLIPMSTGIDINEWLLDKALGRYVNTGSVTKNKKNSAAGYVCFCLPEGIIESIAGIDKVVAFPFVEKIFVDDIAIGEHTEPMTYKGARKGPILVRGNNREELEKNIKTVQKTLNINVRTSEGKMEGIIWS